jgi:hypothetical protein
MVWIERVGCDEPIEQLGVVGVRDGLIVLDIDFGSADLRGCGRLKAQGSEQGQEDCTGKSSHSDHLILLYFVAGLVMALLPMAMRFCQVSFELSVSLSTGIDGWPQIDCASFVSATKVSFQ